MTAFLVAGAESTGTRFFTRVLISAGCWGDGDHDQRLDVSFGGAEKTIVWRRSVPHFKVWPDFDAMLHALHGNGYSDVRLFHLHRRPDCAAKSQVAAGHVETEEQALANIARADQLITDFVTRNNLPVQHVTYEFIVADPASLIPLLASWGLRLEVAPEVVDGNAKWLAPLGYSP